VRLINRNKAAKSTLSQSELFKSFIKGASGACLIFDSELISLEMNGAARKLLGVDRSKKTGSKISEIMPNMENNGRLEILQSVITTGKSIQFRDYLLSSAEEDVQFEVVAFKVATGLGLIICDTSKCDVNAVPLSTESDSLHAIQTVIHDPFIILDSQNRVMNANRAFYAHFNYKAQAVLEESIFGLGEAQWNIAELHELLEHKLSQTGDIKDYEIQGYFGVLGERTLKLNASKYYLETENHLLTFLSIRDITEIAKQRETLKKLSDIYLNAPDPIVITDLQGKIININEEVSKLYGWPKLDLIGSSFKTIIPPNARGQYDKLLQTVIAASQVKDVEVEHWSKHGSVLPIKMDVSLLQNRAGQNVGTVTYIKHIASQSQAEKALKKLYGMLIFSNDPVIILDMNGNITEINTAAEAAYHWTKASITGKPGNTLISPEDHNKYQTCISECFMGKKVQNQTLTRLTKEGGTQQAQISMNMLTDAKNEANGMAIIVKHISDTDKANRVYKKMLQGFMEINDPVIIENMMGEVVDLNQAAATAYGWAKNDIVGKLAKSVIPVDQQKQASELIQRCKAGETIKDFASKRWSKSGHFFPVKLTMFQITDSDEIPQSIVTISRLSQSSVGSVMSSGPIDMEMLFRQHVDAIVIEDLAGNVIEMNAAASKMLAWKVQDLKGKPIKTIIPADLHKHHDKILLLCQNEVPINKVESKRWTKTGQIYQVAVSLVLLKDSEGKPSSIANITWDISDVKNLELQGRNLKKQLGQH